MAHGKHTKKFIGGKQEHENENTGNKTLIVKVLLFFQFDDKTM